jgi:predicted transcriptional regulator
MATVAKILEEKGGGVIRIDGDATVLEAVQAMVEANVGALLVTGSDVNNVEGIFTERDYLRRVAVQGLGER